MSKKTTGKRQPVGIVKHISDKGLTCKIYEELLQLKNKGQITLLKNGQRT